MHYEIAGKKLTCSHCGFDEFEFGQAQLNTATMTFFELDWLNRSASFYICNRCGKIEWFMPTKAWESDTTHSTDCLICGKPISEGEVKCSNCRDKTDSFSSNSAEVIKNNTSNATECLVCGETIPAGVEKCPNCGWSYKS